MARTEKGKRAINVGVIGTGWCGGIRAEACARSPFVKDLHIAEIKEARLKEVEEQLEKDRDALAGEASGHD